MENKSNSGRTTSSAKQVAFHCYLGFHTESFAALAGLQLTM